jgi:hypothetical protein
METGNKIQKYILSTLLIILFLLGVCLAFLAYRYYGAIARGILGIAMLYLMFFYIRFSGYEVLSVDDLISSPNKAKFFFFALVGAMLSYWATMQIAEMVLFIKDKI